MADAPEFLAPYSGSMFLRRPLMFWLRYGGFSICVIEAVTEIDLGGTQPLNLGLWFWARFVLSIFFGMVFLRVVPSRVVPEPSRERLLAFQIMLGFAIDPGVWFLSAFAIPFAVPAAQRSRWLKIHSVLFCVEIVSFFFVAWLQNIANFRWQWETLLHSSTRTAIFVIGAFTPLIANFFAFAGATILLEAYASRQKLERTNRELLELQVAIRESARVEERLRISQELHDAVGHYLTSLSIQLEIASHHALDGARPAIAKSQLITRILLAEIREAVDAWKEDENASLPQMLDRLTQGLTGVHVHIEAAADLPHLDSALTHTLFRSAQEAVTNVLRHSQAENLWITLSRSKAAVRVAIRDDGEGCDRMLPGNGLRGIRARITEVHGEVSIQSDKGRGFEMVITVPLQVDGAA